MPLALAAVAALLWLLPVAPWANQLSSGSVLTALVALYALYVRQKPAKKPLVFTARVKRLLEMCIRDRPWTFDTEIRFTDVSFRYKEDQPDILKRLSLVCLLYTSRCV